jgi:hypothetical protein
MLQDWRGSRCFSANTILKAMKKLLIAFQSLADAPSLNYAVHIVTDISDEAKAA